MRYYLYLCILIVLQLITYIITPLLPLLSKTVKATPINNNSRVASGTKLFRWLSWFDTPDNSLEGDDNFLAKNVPSYISKVKWLYRNSLYGFKWTILSATITDPQLIKYKGDPRVNRNNGIQGKLVATYNNYWQFKYVKSIYKSYGVMLNFGWQLDEFIKDPKPGKALFQFSPRIVRII